MVLCEIRRKFQQFERRWVGFRDCYELRIARRPLYRAVSALILLAQCAREARIHGWDSELCGIPLNQWHEEKPNIFLSSMNRAWNETPRIFRTGNVVYAAVDASQKFGRGGLYFRPDGSTYGVWFQENSEIERDLPAFVLELMAIEEGIRNVPPDTPKLDAIIIATDCEPARAAVRNGYSNSRNALKILKNIWELRESETVDLDIKWVPGMSNAADPISRGLEQETSRNDKTWEILRTTPEVLNSTSSVVNSLYRNWEDLNWDAES